MIRSKDEFLESRIEKLDSWISTGQISYSSRVIPLSISIETKKWILPKEQVVKLLKNVKFIALAKCDCRANYQRCDNPVEICLQFDDVGKKVVEEGQGREITIDEAVEVLNRADEYGLVHLSLYMPDHKLFALCSCCECCCHDLQILKLYNRNDIMVKADFISMTDKEKCIDCGDCVEKCSFDARLLTDVEMKYNPDKCYGCGLCVAVCSSDAIRMIDRI